MITADLNGKTVLVTGALSGVGLAAAELFGSRGATVAVNHLPDDPRAPDVLTRLEKQMNVIAAPGDVGSPADASEVIARTVGSLGKLDYLVNNAGVMATSSPVPFGRLDEMTDEAWQRVIDVNLMGPFRLTRAAAGHLRETRGAVVNTASIAGFHSRGSSSLAYAASKAALINLTESLAVALAPEVRVNAVAPGYIDTDFIASWTPDSLRSAVEATPLGRPASGHDIAEAIFYLAAGAGFITGQTLVVDGGLSL